jgi:hypothetical protein
MEPGARGVGGYLIFRRPPAPTWPEAMSVAGLSVGGVARVTRTRGTGAYVWAEQRGINAPTAAICAYR